MSRHTGLASAIILCCASQVLAAAALVETAERDIEDLAAKARPAFVFIGGGSGAVISATGLMITNAHVVRSDKAFTVRLGDGRSFQAKLLGLDRGGDLALLQIEKGEDLVHLALGDSDALQIGESALAIGNPIALGVVDQTPTFTLGVISALHQYRGIYNDAIVTDAPVNPGNSGGPLLNMRGELVGVNGMVQTRWGLRSSTGLGYAIPSNQIQRFLPLLEAAKGGEIYRGRLQGLQWEPDDGEEDGENPEAAAAADRTDAPRPQPAPAETVKGARIRAVDPESAAAKAGFQAGDVVVRLGGEPVWHRARFEGLVRSHPAGAALEVRVQRGAAETTLSVTLDSLKPGRLGFQLARPSPGDTAMRVGTVETGSPAGKAGLLVGDELVRIQDSEMTGDLPSQFVQFRNWVLRGLYAGQEIRLTVRRMEDGAPVEKNIRYRLE